MKEKIKTILTGILIGIIAFPTLTLGGTFVVSLIQGKSVEEAIQILAEQIDALIGRVEIIETKQIEQEKEILCQKLIKQTPQRGEISYRNIDIVKFYHQHQNIVLEKEQYLSYLKTLPTFLNEETGEHIVRDPKTGTAHSLEERERDLNFFKEVLSEAQPLYHKYIETCGE